ncbi:universal stress protein [Chryseobacterium sp.]|uniref:universal stress protein n=1 Tax=Chryseobacterium sp. TaxID=1871047 RepID=UPI0011C88F2C|nr:universal stress protein [Chryseobacterium sp.]TXF79015.1 universal stress protein [Chryseobacterium sp.]
MRTILAATDFSKPSKNAAYYALNLAIALEADLELCHAYSVPSESPLLGQVSWALYEQPDLVNENTKALEKLIQNLEEKENVLTDGATSTFHPSISYTCEKGNPVEVITAAAAKTEALLIVMAMTGAGALERFILGSNSVTMIDAAKHPLLFIPAGHRYHQLKKIAFATDLNKKDIKTAQWLIKFAHYFNAELLITHITDFSDLIDEDAYEQKKDLFLQPLFHKVSYRYIESDNIDTGLDLLKNKDIDMLVMGHHHRSFFERLTPGSHASRQALHPDIPLLIIPEGSHVNF